jgi:hypothetical protein
MISRRTASALADVYEHVFGYLRRAQGNAYPSGYHHYGVNHNSLYDFLYERGYEAWFCNTARSIPYTDYKLKNRAVKDFLLKLHTGETISATTPDWTWEQREKLGQRYLQDLAEDIINQYSDLAGTPDNSITDFKMRERKGKVKALLSRLQLDGYEYKNSRLLAPEHDVLDVDEETGVLESLYKQLSLPNKEKNFQFLELSEEYYLTERWADSIHNSRKFLEGTLQEVAAAHSSRVNHKELSEGTYKRAVRVREYLEREALLDTKETETLSKVYGLLSETGSHPFMPHGEQARLLRHLALTFSQFVMLRLQGSLK